MADLVKRLDLGRLRRAFRHYQCPDRFHVPVASLGRSELSFTLRRPGCLDRIDHVGLALATPLLAVRPVDLDHRHAGPAQVARQRRPI
jgi:hypothetical protein